MKDYNYQNMNFSNFNISGIMNVIYLISFIFQWSIISMIINLFTLWMFRLPLFFIMILDGLSMLFISNKTIAGPSFILRQTSILFSRLFNTDLSNPQNIMNTTAKANSFINKLSDSLYNTKNKIKNFINKMTSFHRTDNKYKQERQLNKFSPEIGKKVTVESISDGKKSMKSFKYRDRTLSYIHTLESNGYKNYTHYNLDVNHAKSYIIFNSNKDIIDVENNKIKCRKNDKDYDFLINQWPL